MERAPADRRAATESRAPERRASPERRAYTSQPAPSHASASASRRPVHEEPRAPRRDVPVQHDHEHHDERHDHESEAFFSSHPPPQPHDGYHDFEATTGEMDGLRASKRGMYVTLAILALGVLSIGGLVVYNKVLMPTPVELGPTAVALPTPDTLRNAPPAPREIGPAPTPAAPAPQAAAPEAVEAAPAIEPPPAEQAAPVAVEPAPVVEPPPAAPAPEQPLEEGDVAAYDSLLEAARKQGFKKSAEASYLQALGVNPEGVEALSGLAMLYLNQAKNPQARDRARQALVLAPDSAEAWIVLGAALDALGERTAARDAYQKCAALPIEGDGARYVGECKRLLR